MGGGGWGWGGEVEVITRTASAVKKQENPELKGRECESRDENPY